MLTTCNVYVLSNLYLLCKIRMAESASHNLEGLAMDPEVVAEKVKKKDTKTKKEKKKKTNKRRKKKEEKKLSR